MAYQVLARKWRPKTFADLVGQEHVVKALQNALGKGRLHHAYLLTGTRGVGKTTIARILAKSLNCETPHEGEPCGQCQSCRDIDTGRFVDLLEIDAASNTGIDNIREVLENAQYAPTAGKYKVYIIDEVHMLSKSAFNAMLKTLEEPPEHVKFILATTDPHKVPVTVLSRCLQFVLRNMTAQQVSQHLAHVLTSEQIPYEAPALALLGRAAAGSMRDALSLLDQAIAMGSGSVTEADVRHMIGAVDQRYLYSLLQAAANQDGAALLATAQEMAGRAIGFDSALSELALLLQKLALIKTIPAAVPADDPERDTLQQLAGQLGDEQIQLYYQCVIHGKQDLPLAPDEYAGFVMTLLRLLAFAPLAAAELPEGSQISGSELHDPAPKPRPATTPQPDNARIPAENHPAEAPPAQAEPRLPESGHNSQNEHGSFSGSPNNNGRLSQNNPLPRATATAARHTERLPENISGSPNGQHGLSPNPNASGNPAPGSAEPGRPYPSEPQPTQTEAVPTAFESNPPWDDAPPPAGFESGLPDSPPSPGLAETEPGQNPANGFPHSRNQNDSLPQHKHDTASRNESGLGSERLPETEQSGFLHSPNRQTEAQSAAAETPEHPGTAALPLPDADTWPHIVAAIAPKIGAAQMSAQHTACLGYDPQQHLLTLAVAEAGQVSISREHIQRIEQHLAAAYGHPVSIRTTDWPAGGTAAETPAMRQQRLRQAARDQAQSLLEQDPAAQDILNLFGARWLPESLVLQENGQT
ncbi:DNA polymerase III subunit gamma/tau [Eikenella corrodens]|uniref:DNA polymerase III subunit gamma/tau n=1 Tax=Eikenella corrodens TaxID=539 RepID=A0A1A9RCU8_EIKCO|nr:DNA polymerase III subunit gamma/tau [Eikenella corrodens]OAM16635.1 DNA polymerase III, subunit gamma and tau [Eikenella corrodens]